MASNVKGVQGVSRVEELSPKGTSSVVKGGEQQLQGDQEEEKCAQKISGDHQWWWWWIGDLGAEALQPF